MAGKLLQSGTTSSAAVRAMERADIAEVRALLEEAKDVTLLPSETDDLLARALARNPGASSVALIEGAIVGSCFALQDGVRGSFRHVVVKQGHQGGGIGQALLEGGYQYFRQQGITRIIIQVALGNTRAKNFWLQQGFRLSSGEGGVIVSLTKDLTV